VQHFPRFWSAFLLLTGALILSGCSTIIPAESWAGMTIDKDGQYAYVTNKESVFKVALSDTAGQNSTTAHFVVWRSVLPSNVDSYTPPVFSPDGSTLYVGAFDKKE